MFDVKANFSSMYLNNSQCDHCDSGERQTQRHLLESCDTIILKSKFISENVTVDHDHIYGNLYQQFDVTKLFEEILHIREQIKPSQQ